MELIYCWEVKKTVQENKYLIVGLGNPGKKYIGTRHNVGFDFIECLAKELNIKLNNSKFNSIYGTGKIGEKDVVIAMPVTFMNLSGEAVEPLAKYYKIPVQNIIVCYDDIYLPTGKLRIRKSGSAGGHNGMKSIIARLRSMDFLRIRIGVSEKPNYMDLADYVLSKFDKSEYDAIDTGIENAVEACKLIVIEDVAKAMNKFN